MDNGSFTVFHPVVPTVLFVGIIALSMFGLTPAFVLISFTGAVIYAWLTLGIRSSLEKLKWQLPLLLLVCIINPFFSAMGSTLLFRVGPFRIYGESLAFGAVMGTLLVCVLMWIEALAHAVGRDELLIMGSGVLPKSTLALSAVAGLVPQLMKRARLVKCALEVNDPISYKRGVRSSSRVLSSLVTWALEDSLERSDAMRARAWGVQTKRSTYMPHPLKTYDIWILVGIVALELVSAWGLSEALLGWTFYPRMVGTAPWWVYVPMLILCLLPSASVLYSRFRWEFAQ